MNPELGQAMEPWNPLMDVDNFYKIQARKTEMVTLYTYKNTLQKIPGDSMKRLTAPSREK